MLLSDPAVAAVPIHECGEELRDVREAGFALDGREADSNDCYARLRAGVVHRLLQAEASLPPGVQLCLVEGYRTTKEQARRFDLYAERIRDSGIDDPQEVRRQVSAFVSPVEVAPHCTGGAVDLTLVDGDGQELDMGGQVNAHRHQDEASCPLEAAGLSPAARANRHVLVASLTEAGFVNYPTEWWHWSYGDRYWALRSGAPAAIYGPFET